jgi:hypothetical protein
MSGSRMTIVVSSLKLHSTRARCKMQHKRMHGTTHTDISRRSRMTIGKFGRTVKTQYSARTAARAHAHAAVHSRKAPIDHVRAALPHDSQCVATGRLRTHSDAWSVSHSPNAPGLLCSGP